MRPTKTIRVLHILGQLCHGGVQVWLMNVLRALDRSKFQFDFAVHSLEDGVFVPEARQLGAEIHLLPPPRKSPWSYGRSLARRLRECGPFDAVHSHVHFFSGHTLAVAGRCGVPIRIAHSHINDNGAYAQGSAFRRVYRHVMRQRIARSATAGLACSSDAAAALFGPQWQHDIRWQVLPYGLDFSRFFQPFDTQSLRQTLGIPPNRKIIGHVARLDAQKNHTFAIQVIEELVRRGADVHYLPVGGGPLESAIREQISQAGLADRATVVGDQRDVAPYFALMNCMLFPSHNEGLPLAVLESQAAGVPVIASDRVPLQVVVVPKMVERLSLDHPAAMWADAVKQQLAARPWNSQETAAALAASEMGVGCCLQRLCGIYAAQSKSGG